MLGELRKPLHLSRVELSLKKKLDRCRVTGRWVRLYKAQKYKKTLPFPEIRSIVAGHCWRRAREGVEL